MSNLSMSYSDMTDKSTVLKQLAGDLRDLMERMTTEVNGLCDGWTAEASPIFRDDYTAIAGSVTKTSEVVDELTATVDQYIADMQELDSSYAKSKVNIG